MWGREPNSSSDSTMPRTPLQPHPPFSLSCRNSRNKSVQGVTKKPGGRSQPSCWQINLQELSPQQLLHLPGPGGGGGGGTVQQSPHLASSISPSCKMLLGAPGKQATWVTCLPQTCLTTVALSEERQPHTDSAEDSSEIAELPNSTK